MHALVDYGSSSNDSDDDTAEVAPKENPKPKLPKPSLGEALLHCSVFANPFVEAELAKAAILERHVKMVPGKECTQMINGKKICWNYRKGRCRFGHNCKYAHDSDIQKTPDELEQEKMKLLQNTAVFKSPGPVVDAPPPDDKESAAPAYGPKWKSLGARKKKRQGLCPAQVPRRKLMGIYKQAKLRGSAENNK